MSKTKEVQNNTKAFLNEERLKLIPNCTSTNWSKNGDARTNSIDCIATVQSVNGVDLFGGHERKCVLKIATRDMDKDKPKMMQISFDGEDAIKFLSMCQKAFNNLKNE